MKKLKVYTLDVPENIEPMVEVKFCEKSELSFPKYQKLSKLDKMTSNLDAELSSKINEKSGIPVQTYRMFFNIYYVDEDKIQKIPGKINIGDGNGGIVGQLKVQNEIWLTDESYLAYQQAKGKEVFRAYIADLTDMQKNILPYLQSFVVWKREHWNRMFCFR